MDVYEATLKRRAIRRFQDRAVPYEVLEKCIDAARMGPNGHNHQILEFCIVDDPEMISGVLDCYGRPPNPSPEDEEDMPKPGQHARAFIAILINTDLERETGVPREGHMPAVGAAAENAMLVALQYGVGSCPMMGLNRNAFKRLLGIPDNYEVPMMISLGYADETAVADEFKGSVKRWIDDQGVRHVPKRSLADIMHRNKF